MCQVCPWNDLAQGCNTCQWNENKVECIACKAGTGHTDYFFDSARKTCVTKCGRDEFASITINGQGLCSKCDWSKLPTGCEECIMDDEGQFTCTKCKNNGVSVTRYLDERDHTCPTKCPYGFFENKRDNK